MRSFDEIFAISAGRHGGPEALEAQLSVPKSADELAAIPEDRWLSQIAKCIFQAGFNWKVIEDKWDRFEKAFAGFDVGRVALMDEAWFDRLITDKSIVRNGPKIRAVQEYAAFLLELRGEGGAGQVLGRWPSTDYVGLLDMLKTRGSRIGGNTGQYSLRFIGRDGFILSRDVTARLIAEGVVDKPPASKGAMRKVQVAFNTWMGQSGRGLTQISQVLARSTG
jgi:3-methyladenine DNA glycosylase Tag